MSRRNLARPGLSYVDANRGRVSIYTMEQDVVDARRRLEAEFPGVRVLWDNETKEHLFIATDLENTDYLVFSTKDFHEEELRQRLHLADNEKNKEDVWVALEKHEEARQKEVDYQLGQKIQEMGEKLAWAFAKDGLTVRPRVSMSGKVGNR